MAIYQAAFTFGSNNIYACNIDLENIVVAFQASPGVDPKKATTDWIKNHYRWIIWKLASLERRFPNKCAGLFHPDEVIYY